MEQQSLETVVVEVGGGLVLEVHNANWLAIDWDIFESGPDDAEVEEFREHVEGVAAYVKDEQTRSNLLNHLKDRVNRHFSPMGS